MNWNSAIECVVLTFDDALGRRQFGVVSRHGRCFVHLIVQKRMRGNIQANLGDYDT